MAPAITPSTEAPVVVLGGGYAGLSVTQHLLRASQGHLPITLVDRHPVHVLRTELYELGRLAQRPDELSMWAVSLARLLGSSSGSLRVGEVESIDLKARTIQLSGEPVRFSALAICLGSVPSYYGVPGAAELCESVYRLTGAQRLAHRIREVEVAAGSAGGAVAPRIVVIGGGSTGTEVAAEIATVDWSKVLARPVPAPEVRLIAGALPFLAGLPAGLIAHARKLLSRAGVLLDEGRNVARVEPEVVQLTDGTRFPYDIAVWAAGVQAPEVIRNLETGHGHAGRLRVDATLELPGHPGIFAVGDVAEHQDPQTHLIAPASAQAALAEAPVAARNLLARIQGTALRPFRYREKGVIVSVGIGEAVANIQRITLWGRPVALVKAAVQERHRLAARRAERPRGS